MRQSKPHPTMPQLGFPVQPQKAIRVLQIWEVLADITLFSHFHCITPSFSKEDGAGGVASDTGCAAASARNTATGQMGEIGLAHN